MSDEYVGYGHPPRAYRFKKGTSGNPHGRPKGRKLTADETIRKVLGKQVVYRENGKEQKTSWQELTVRSAIQRAIEGSTTAANQVLRLLQHAERHGDPGVEHVYIEDWLPDHPGQTGEQKTMSHNESKEPPVADPGAPASDF